MSYTPMLQNTPEMQFSIQEFYYVQETLNVVYNPDKQKISCAECSCTTSQVCSSIILNVHFVLFWS